MKLTKVIRASLAHKLIKSKFKVKLDSAIGEVTDAVNAKLKEKQENTEKAIKLIESITDEVSVQLTDEFSVTGMPDAFVALTGSDVLTIKHRKIVGVSKFYWYSKDLEILHIKDDIVDKSMANLFSLINAISLVLDDVNSVLSVANSVDALRKVTDVFDQFLPNKKQSQMPADALVRVNQLKPRKGVKS